jgi:hypothetical protein
MIVTGIQHVVNYVRDNFQTRVYKTLQDPVTSKEIVICEVYTSKGVIENSNDKGKHIDKEI